jgi:hypothetical protein
LRILVVLDVLGIWKFRSEAFDDRFGAGAEDGIADDADLAAGSRDAVQL